jgi:hypothetical protein
MKPKLLTYKHVPPGFEIVIDNTDVEMGKAWSLWHNVKLTDDPESWDNEIRSINKMQSALGELNGDQRLVRAQMAEFCRVSPVFPESIEVLCREIGENRFFKPLNIGCEGRGLLNSLGYHDPSSLNGQQTEILKNYAHSLEKWLEQDHPKTAIESKVFGFLGQSTDKKVSLVKRVIDGFNPDKPSACSLRKLAENASKETYKGFRGLAHESYVGRPFNCFKCLQEEIPVSKCQCCYSMFLDASILCIGTSEDERSPIDEFKRFVEENVLAYSVAINSWLKETPSKLVTSMITARCIATDRAEVIAENVHRFLGEKDEIKEWLAACLLKTVKDNQRWHKTIEIVDNFPVATSWLKEKS